MPTYAVTNPTRNAGFVDSLVAGTLTRLVIEPGERVLLTADVVRAHSKYVTVEELAPSSS